MPEAALPRAREATAPCRLELIDGTPGGGDGPYRLAVALDRRVHCRAEPTPGRGIEIHSKDSLERLRVSELSAIATSGDAIARAARALAAAGLQTDVGVTIHEKVPTDAGLGNGCALSVALAGLLSPDATAEEVVARARLIEGSVSTASFESDFQAARHGGAHALVAAAGGDRVLSLAIDPARLEECLMIVDPGSSAVPLAGARRGGRLAGDLVDALGRGRYRDAADVLRALHRDALEAAPPQVARVIEAAQRAQAAAWPSGRLLAVFASPGERGPGPKEALIGALREAGHRFFPARVDVLGLEVEEAG